MNFRYHLRSILSFLLFSSFGLALYGQDQNRQANVIPFLRFTPDARAGAMGDAGVAVIPDGHSMSINAAKLPFLDHTYGFSLSYNPWLKNLHADIHLGYLSGYYQVSERNTLAASIRYFSLGEVQLADINQQSLGTYYPNEFAVDATFARKYGRHFGLATTLRYISSKLMSFDLAEPGQGKASTAVAADVSVYYKNNMRLLHQDVVFGAGANISNLGHKIASGSSAGQYFLPANLKFGTAVTFLSPELNQFTFALDFNKSLVPDGLSADEGFGISVPSAIAWSFADTNGDFWDELEDIDMAIGFEYLFHQQFALRAGYSKYLTLGTGFTYQSMGLDIAYIAASQEKSPLANSLRFSLHFNFDKDRR